MSNASVTGTNTDEPLRYQIRVKGHLDCQWEDWFGNLTITLEDNGDTLLTGPVVDQAALHGLLKKVRDLGMPLVSMGPVECNQADAAQCAAINAFPRTSSTKRTEIVQNKDRKMNSIRKTARMAGIFYLIFIIMLSFAGLVRPNLVKYADAAATANNVAASTWLFRIDFMSDLLSAVFFLLAAWALYALLKDVDHNLALLFLLLNLSGVAIQSLNLLNQFAALLLLSGADYLKAFPTGQLQAMALLFLNLYKSGFIICQIFFGAWLFPLGYLVFKSGFLPKILGILLIADGFGVMIWFLQFFLFPGFELVTYPGLAVSAVAEFSLSFWLIIMGVKVQKPALLEAAQ